MASTNTVKTIKIELLRKFAMSNAAALYTEVQFLFYEAMLTQVRSYFVNRQET